MKIDKVIFGVDDNPLYADFWPIQANLVKTILKADPVLFHITNEDRDFYFDGHGTVKKINKDNCFDLITSFQSQVVRMYSTKYFQNEVCMTADIDMLMINENYFLKQIENFDEESLVIMDSKAYDLERIECQNHNESCENRYPICYIIGKGKNFNKVLNTDRSFEEYTDELRKLRLGWGTDELYFGDKVDNTNHGVNVVKLVRNYTTPWKAEKRIDRHNFPVILKHEGEIEAQKRDEIYSLDKLKSGFYIDAHCPRPYIEYKNKIDELVEIIKKEEKIKELLTLPRMFYADYNTINNFDWGWMENLEVTNLKSLLVKEVFEDRIYERFFSVEEGDIVLDIGSSVGPFAYSILNKKPKHVYCLEPSSIEFSTLNKNLRGYPVTPINKGIGEHNNGFYSDVVFGEFGNEKTFIESINFSTLLKNYNLDKIDFFKIDCEGGEYHVFTPEHLEFLKTIPKITGEWHLQTEEEKSLFRNFRDNILPNFNNYEVYSVDDVNVKWDLWNEHFIEYYRQVIIHIDNR